MSFNLNSLWLDWRAKVPDGTPNPSNAYHLVLLKELCLSKGIDTKTTDSVILFLERKMGDIILSDDDKFNRLESKKIVLDDKFYSWLEENLSDDDFITEARVYKKTYITGDAFQITSDAGLSTFDGKPILNYDEESGDFKDSGKKFNASQLFKKQSETKDIEKPSVNYVLVGKGGTQVTLKGDDGVTYVIDAAKSNWSKFSKAKPVNAINWMDASLETAQGLGLYLKKDYATPMLTAMKSENETKIAKLQLELINDVRSSLGKGNFASKGVSAIKSKLETASIDSWYRLAILAAGMIDFKHKDLGTTIVHAKIEDYYKALRANTTVDTSGVKKNTGDMVLTNASSDDALISEIGDPISPDVYRHISYNKSSGVCYIHEGPNEDTKKTGTEFIQMSMKAKSGGAQLGKISGLIRKYFHMKQNTEYIIDFIGEGFLSKAFDKVKQVGKAVISKITDIASKVFNIGNKFLNKWEGKKGKKSTINNFFKKNKKFKGAVKKAVKEGIVKGEYQGDNLLLEKTAGKLSFDDKLIVLGNDQTALDDAITLTQGMVDSLVKTSAPAAIAVAKETDLAKNVSMDLESIYKLMSNYVTADLLISMVKDGKKKAKDVQALLNDFAILEKEMIFGRSSLPIWKVYGRDEKNTSATHIYYGGSTEFIKQKTISAGNVKNKIILGTGITKGGSKNFYTFTIWFIEGIGADGSEYTEFRVGTNKGDAGFSWVFEGTKSHVKETYVKSKTI
jgi:hypothetical protein